MYRLSDVAAAIDPENREKRLGALRNWFARGILNYSEAHGDKPPAGAGTPAVLSRYTLILAAIASRLTDLGVPPEQAVHAARPFLGNTHSHMASLPREFGEVFKDGETVLFVWRSEDGDYKSKVCKIGSGGFDNHRQAIASLGSSNTQAVIVVDCRRVLDNLNWLLSRPF